MGRAKRSEPRVRCGSSGWDIDVEDGSLRVRMRMFRGALVVDVARAVEAAHHQDLRICFGLSPDEADTLYAELADAAGIEVQSRSPFSDHHRAHAHRRVLGVRIEIRCNADTEGCEISTLVGFSLTQSQAISLCEHLAPCLGWSLN